MNSSQNNKLFGNKGEEIAAKYLKKQGYTILSRQFLAKTIKGEIDIIAKKDTTYIFVEVKHRKTMHNIYASEIITKKKQQNIIKMTLLFCQQESISISENIIRFDVIYIVENKIDHYENAFTYQ